MFEQERALDGFRLVDGRLTLGEHAQRWPRREVLRFEPAGVVAVDHDGEQLLYPWTRYVDEAGRPGSWSLEPAGYGVGERSSFAVLLCRRYLDGSTGSELADGPPLRWLPLALPLAHFLGTMSELRPALDDPFRLERLLADIAAYDGEPEPPRPSRRWKAVDPVIADELDRRLHRYAGRAIAGEPKLRLVDVVTAVRRRGVIDAELPMRIRRHAEVAPWPFAALRP